jgi:hypothetical protein
MKARNSSNAGRGCGGSNGRAANYL